MPLRHFRHSRLARRLILAAIIVAGVIAAAASQLPAIGAGGLLHPWRRTATATRPTDCDDVVYKGVGVQLRGWRCEANNARRGTLVYLHGIADNRASGAGVIERFTQRGFDVIAYDSRAHGQSEGDACTYGFYEKDDLRAVLDTVPAGPIVLLGTSLGAAVALQAAAIEHRISAVVAAETFSDLTTVATERAPFVFTAGLLRRAFQLAEERGHFRVDAVSPVTSAAQIKVPVMLIHGEMDTDTPADHSRRVYDALRGPKRLLIVPGAGHNASLRNDVWEEIERWIDDAVAGVLR